MYSDRTDAGVHALSTTAGVDLQRSDVCNDVFFNPKHITLRLNDYLAKSGIDIRYGLWFFSQQILIFSFLSYFEHYFQKVTFITGCFRAQMETGWNETDFDFYTLKAVS